MGRVRLLEVGVYLLCLASETTGISLSPCPLAAVENTETTVTCSGISSTDTVVWTRTLGTVDTSVGLCTPLPASCDSRISSIIELSRSRNDVSTMTVKSATRSLFGGATVACSTVSGSTLTGSNSCRMDVIYPAEASSCTISPDTSSRFGPWTVNGSCYVTKVFSTVGNYTCQLYQHGTSLSIGESAYSPALSGSPSYGQGTCSYSANLPTTSGIYTYTVTVGPGGTSKIAGTVTVDVPSPPASDCPTEYVPESSYLDCMCSSSNLGVPKGRVMWQGTSSARLRVTSVTKDLNNKQYTCQLQWNPASAVITSNYTLRVAYGPAIGSTSISGPAIFDTDGSRQLTLKCLTSGVNPTPIFTWSGACSGQDQTCHLMPGIPNDVTAICRVTNSKNNGKSDTTTINVILNCE